MKKNYSAFFKKKTTKLNLINVLKFIVICWFLWLKYSAITRSLHIFSHSNLATLKLIFVNKYVLILFLFVYRHCAGDDWVNTSDEFSVPPYCTSLICFDDF